VSFLTRVQLAHNQAQVIFSRQNSFRPQQIHKAVQETLLSVVLNC